MRVIALILFLVIASTAATFCPKWKCDDKLAEGYCFKLDKASNTISASNQVTNLTACYILDFYEGKNEVKINEKGKPTDPKKIYADLQKKFCSQTNFTKMFDCDSFCQWKTSRVRNKYDYTDISSYTGQSKTKKTWNCYYSDYLKQNGHQEDPKKKSRHADCTSNDQCASGKCLCVPNVNGTGKCTTSVFDDAHENFVKEVCGHGYSYRRQIYEFSNRDVAQKDKMDKDDTCAYWLMIHIGHIMDALDDQEGEKATLPCLLKFSDYLAMELIEDEVGISWLAIAGGAVAILGVCCFGIFQAATKGKKKEEISKQD